MAVSWAEPTGCDGLAAALRTFGAFGVHAACVVSAVRLTGAAGPRALPYDYVAAQVKAAMGEAGSSPVCLSVIGDAEADAASAGLLQQRPQAPVIVDATLLGAGLATPEAITAIKSKVAPGAALLLADVAAAQALTGLKLGNQTAIRAASKLLHRLGCKAVLINGVGLPGEEWLDILYDGKETFDFPGEKPASAAPQGVGVAYCAAITAGLAYGRSVEESVAIAKIFLVEAVRNGYAPGQGPTTVSPLYAWWAAGGANGYGG